ncbi:MAG: DUF2157 domain-containing protein [Chloroflexota bacterium]|nr:MAG: DUF2157 domain-containing protein [Chloroflexota bacterium]
MPEQLVLGRIDAWVGAGLIDEATATRLRAAEAAAPPEPVGASAPASRRRTFPLGAVFGPGVSVGEMFGYLGGAFVLAAWLTMVAQTTRPGQAYGVLAAAVVLAVLGIAARTQSPRLTRAAGVAFLVAGASLFGGTYLLIASPSETSAQPQVVAAAVWLVAAVAFRRLHRALLAQLGLIVAIVVAAAVSMRWLEEIIFGPVRFDIEPEPDSPARVVLLALGWLIAAVVLGVLGLVEARGTDPATRTRAALTRLAAGLTAVLGTATAVFASGYLEGNDYGRLIEPVLGDAALMVVSAVLLQRAFWRQASSYVYPAALGVVIGLSDLNAQYLSTATSTEFALLVEGLILLAAGLGFDRLRRRVGALADEDEAGDDGEGDHGMPNDAVPGLA